MTGLREKKKQATKQAILGAAHELMAKHGFEATSMESVAVQAEVSVGSLYNYFADKRALLVGVFAESTFRALGQGKKILASDSMEMRPAIQKLIHLYAKAFQRLEKELLRQALGMSFTMEAEDAQDFAQFDRLMMEQLGALIAQLQSRKCMSGELNGEQVTLALYGTFIVSILIWLSTPSASLRDLLRTIDQQLEVVFRGLEPRNDIKNKGIASRKIRASARATISHTKQKPRKKTRTKN